MTIQQEAYQLIDSLSDDGVRAIIHVMTNMKRKEEPVPADLPESKVKSRKELAFERMEELRKESAQYTIVDFAAERDQAMAEKYGRIS